MACEEGVCYAGLCAVLCCTLVCCANGKVRTDCQCAENAESFLSLSLSLLYPHLYLPGDGVSGSGNLSCLILSPPICTCCTFVCVVALLSNGLGLLASLPGLPSDVTST